RAGAPVRRVPALAAAGGLRLRAVTGPGDVCLEHAAPRELAAIRATVRRADLGREIIRMLDRIWPLLREQRVRTGHNVVVYHGGDERTLDVDVGVEIFDGLAEFQQRGEVRRTRSPSGEVATVAYWGAYAEIGRGYAALDAWCRAHDRR